MLQSIHDKFKGWLAGLVLGAIALVFVFWGINWTMSAPTYAAKVNGSEIPAAEVRQAYQRQLAQFERQSNAPPDDTMRGFVKQRVLDQYVNSEALVTRADELGYRVSDNDVVEALKKIPALQEDGKFDMARAMAVLRSQGRSIGEIEALIKRDVKLQQLDAALAVSSFVTPAEMKQLENLTRQQRELTWLTLPAVRYAADTTPDEAAVKAYYDAHKSAYLTPETVDLRYVEISLAAMQAGIKVDDAQLKAYYEDQKAKAPERFAQAEQRRVRHILFSVTDPKADASVKTKAEAVLKRAESGEDFAKLATEFSQDPGSASQGGDLGWSDRKVWVAPFADAAYSMKVGEIRGLVKTQFGYHILKLDGIQAAAEKSFDQAKPDLDTDYRRSEAERLFNNAQDQLADAALQSSADIDVAARKAGLTVKDIPNFSRIDGGGDLVKAQPVIDAAFSTDVLEGHLSPMVEVEKGRGVVLRATDHKLPQQKPLDVVRADIVAAWKKERGVQLARAAAQAAVKRLDAGESWSVVAKTLGGGTETAKFVGRSDDQVPLEIRQAAFEAPKPAPKPIFRDVELADGDAGLFALTAVRQDPSAEAAPAENALRQQFSRQLAGVEAQGYAAAVRSAAKVSLNPQALE